MAFNAGDKVQITRKQHVFDGEIGTIAKVDLSEEDGTTVYFVEFEYPPKGGVWYTADDMKGVVSPAPVASVPESDMDANATVRSSYDAAWQSASDAPFSRPLGDTPDNDLIDESIPTGLTLNMHPENREAMEDDNFRTVEIVVGGITYIRREEIPEHEKEITALKQDCVNLARDIDERDTQIATLTRKLELANQIIEWLIAALSPFARVWQLYHKLPRPRIEMVNFLRDQCNAQPSHTEAVSGNSWTERNAYLAGEFANANDMLEEARKLKEKI